MESVLVSEHYNNRPYFIYEWEYADIGFLDNIRSGKTTSCEVENYSAMFFIVLFRRSRDFNLRSPQFCELFIELADQIRKELEEERALFTSTGTEGTDTPVEKCGFILLFFFC